MFGMAELSLQWHIKFPSMQTHFHTFYFQVFNLVAMLLKNIIQDNGE